MAAAQPQQQPEARRESSTSTAVSAPATQPPSTPQIVSDVPRPPQPEPAPPVQSQPDQPGQQQHSVHNNVQHQQSAPRPPPPPIYATVPPPTQQAPSQGPPPHARYTGYTPGPPQQGPPQPGPPPVHLHAHPPGQGQWRPNLDHNAAMRRPVIMDPPRRQQVEPPRDGFASPEHDHARENPRFLEDQQRLAYTIDQSMPAAVRRVIRDNWEKCLLGSDFHQAFVVSNNSSHSTLFWFSSHAPSTGHLWMAPFHTFVCLRYYLLSFSFERLLHILEHLPSPYSFLPSHFSISFIASSYNYHYHYRTKPPLGSSRFISSSSLLRLLLTPNFSFP